MRETVAAGWNLLVGGDTDRIVEAVHDFLPPVEHPPLFGDGHAADRIAAALSAGPIIFGQNYDRVALPLLASVAAN
jgi:UDP-N-acetylglucosamine 2-epimerase